MQLNPCKWDSISPCKECKKDICSSCHNQEFCDSCIMESEETCFAFCDVTKEPILSTIDINFPEQYAVIRCRRERKKNFDSKYYSGFCKEHCETSENIQDLYSGLPEYRKKAIHYMISSNTCDFLNAPKFLTLGIPHATRDMFQLINTPMGYMSINPMYFALFLESFLQEEFLRESISDAHSKNNVQRFMSDDYIFLANLCLSDFNVKWLCEKHSETRVLHWNMLYYKISSMFMLCVNPDYLSAIPMFSGDWKEKWYEFGKYRIPNDAVTLALWDDFLYMMSFVVNVVNREIENTNRQGGANKTVEDIFKTYKELSETTVCKLQTND